MKEKELSITVGMTIPLSGMSGPFFVKPIIELSAELEDGDDVEKCSETLHHRAVCIFMNEVYRQAAIAGQINVSGFKKARTDITAQAKYFLEMLEEDQK